MSKSRGQFIPATHTTRLEALMDVIRFGPELLKRSAFMALLFHVERSLGYGKSADAASLQQMAVGIDNRKTGQRIRGSAGISKAAAATANLDLENMGLIRRQLRSRENGGCDSTSYEVQWIRLAEFFVKKVGEKINHPCPGFRQAPVQDLDRGGVQDLDRPLSRIWTPTEYIEQSSSSSEGIETESSALEAASSSTKQRGGRRKQTPRELGHSGTPEQKSKASFFPKVDDDEAPNPKREPLADSREEFKARVAERHPGEDSEDLLKKVQRTLSRNGNAKLVDFLARDSKDTTGKIRNPGGYYVGLAKSVAAESMTVGWVPIQVPQTEAKPEAPRQRCPKCKGPGCFVGNGKITGYCDCELGRTIEMYDRKKAATKTETAP